VDPTTETIQATATGELRVDTTRKYALNAGKCEQCGQYKTWDFRVANVRTGKQLPGHVTADGYKIGEGDCPYWARIRALNERRAADRKGGATALDTEMVRATGKPIHLGGSNILAATILGIPATPNNAAPQASTSNNARQAENNITVMIHGVPVTMCEAEALNVCRQILEAVSKLYTSSR
jgi:hypothetical protein